MEWHFQSPTPLTHPISSPPVEFFAQEFLWLIWDQAFFVCFSNPTSPPRSPSGLVLCVPSYTFNKTCSDIHTCHQIHHMKSALSGIWTTIRRMQWSTEWQSWRDNELSQQSWFWAKLIASKILPLRISISIITPGQTRTCLVCLLFDWAILFACSRLESIHNVSYQSRPDKY